LTYKLADDEGRDVVDVVELTLDSELESEASGIQRTFRRVKMLQTWMARVEKKYESNYSNDPQLSDHFPHH
jgi:hypothetical protein